MAHWLGTAWLDTTAAPPTANYGWNQHQRWVNWEEGGPGDG